MHILVWHSHAHVSGLWRLLWRQVGWHGAQGWHLWGSRSHTVSVSDSDTEDRLYCRM